MRIVVTGADGFIGKNLRLRLRELGHSDVVSVTRACGSAELYAALAGADFVFHLAGVNRPQDPREYAAGNAGFTGTLCEVLAAGGHRVPVAYASSTQAALDNLYGRSKKDAEDALLNYAEATGSFVHLFRFTNVFGKWCRPNYNSGVATFCHNIARGLPITVNDPAATLRLIYVDDVVDALIQRLASPAGGFVEAGPVYTTTVGEVVQMIQGFAEGHRSFSIPSLASGLASALYATYMSSLPPESFDRMAAVHADAQGEFAGVLKSPECGHFSYLALRPGVSLGERYPRSGGQSFLVARGTARFAFRHLESGQLHVVIARGGEARMVDVVPGWAHTISNIGGDELLMMAWASKDADTAKPKANP